MKPSCLSALPRLCAVLLAALAVHAPAQADPYLGEVRCGVWNFAPTGWATLSGQTLSISQNQALFALLGTTYGGNGVSTFSLPDLRGRVILTQGGGIGLTPRTMGEQDGSETTTLSVAQMPTHSHSVALPGAANVGDTQSPAGKAPAAQARSTLYATAVTPAVPMAAAAVSTAGSSQPISNMQPYLKLTCIIAMQGIFPSRQ